jgi:chemotaxis protein CheD
MTGAAISQTEWATKVVGIADCIVSSDPADTLATYALGSCIAVMMYDPVVRVGGLLHFLLPDCSLDSARGRSNPLVYADTGILILIERCLQYGAAKRRLVVSAAGGASTIANSSFFDVGRRNYMSCRKALWKAGLLIHAEEIGGSASRSVRIDIATGKIWIKRDGGTSLELIPARRTTAKDGHGK